MTNLAFMAISKIMINKYFYTLCILCFSICSAFSQNCNQLVNVSVDNFGTVVITPDMMIEGPLDSTSTYSVSPMSFDCSDVDTVHTVTVTEITGAGVTQTCQGQVLVEDKQGPIAIANIGIVVSVSNDPNIFTTITADDIDEGSYDNCSAVTLELSQSSFNVWDIGTVTVVLTATDQSGNSNTAWTTVDVVGSGGSGSLLFCDTECHATPLGDCNSGHTSEDVIELPCDIDLGSIGEVALSTLSPANLITLYDVSVADSEVELIDSTGLLLATAYDDVVLITPPLIKVTRTWTIIEWYSGQTTEYVQHIEFEGSLVEATDPTLDLADITWPDDIAINDLRITPDQLFNISNVPFEDTRPILSDEVLSSVEIDYVDEIVGLGSYELDIDREWNVSDGGSSFQQIQRINITVDSNIDSLVTVTTHLGRAMPDVDLNGIVSTNDQGIAYLEPSSDIELEFIDAPFNNVDILDLSLIRKHILAINTLSPYQQIAADINGNLSVSSLDLVLLQRMIIGIDDAADVLVWNFEESANLFSERNYIGYKKGDINDDSVLGNAQPNPVDMYIQDALINAGQSYTANLGIGSLFDVSTLDLNLLYDTDELEIQNVYINTDSERLPILFTTDNDGRLRIVDAVLGAASIDQSTSEQLTDALIEIEFISGVSGLLSQMLEFDDALTSYIVNENDEVFIIDGNISGEILTNTDDVNTDSELSIYPNPASDVLNIMRTQLSEKTLQNAQTIIYGPMGRVVYTNAELTSTISLEGFSTGLHTLSVITSEGVHSHQFMINR